MLKKEYFKGEEAIVLESQCLKVVIIPGIGGKIASIYDKSKNFELLFQNKHMEYMKPKLYSAFEEFDAAGFDDAFPTIDVSMVEYQGRKIEYPDHGEIWSSSFNVKNTEDNQVHMEYNSKILPYIFTKKICLNKENEIKISYSIINQGEENIPCLFAAHYLVNCEKDMEICLPKHTKEIMMAQHSTRFGKAGTTYDYTKEIVQQIFSHVQGKEARNTEKYYVNHAVEEGICSIKYHKEKVEYVLKYDAKKLPYLGFWVTEGGFRGDYNCALEPCNGFYDSIDMAKKNKALYYLKSGEKLDFDISIEIRELQ